MTPEDVLAAIPTIAASYDEPFGNSSALPAYFCARYAKQEGIAHLLGGDGGDEIYAGNERYAKQGVFEHYHRLPAWLRHRALEPLLVALPDGLMPVRKARSYVQQANVPLPDRLQTYNFLRRFGMGDDPPARRARRASTPTSRSASSARSTRGPQDASALNRMLYLDWQITLADNDLRKVSRACDLAGVEVSYPLLDDEVVELANRIPSSQKLRHGRLRHFYKEATKGFLPPEIIAKKKHGFGLPFGVWLVEHEGLKQLAYDSLLSPQATRPTFARTFIDDAIAKHAGDHASYYGELVWVLMVLELWLAAH